MTRGSIGIALALAVAMVLATALPAQAVFTKPWDDLAAEPNPRWIDSNSVNMYPANSAKTYTAMFSKAKSSGGARGMNSLKFVDTTDAHHVSHDLVGSVDVLASGNESFGDVLVLVAIDATSLPGDFALSMNGYGCDTQADFVYYDGTQYAAGRPSGYYPGKTNPTGEPIAYDFQSAMVTLLAFEGVTLDSVNSYNLDYAFENLPGRAVMSLYALPNGASAIQHTNRGLYDLNAASTVSTFEVVPEPASLAMLACGVVALLGRKRRRH